MAIEFDINSIMISKYDNIRFKKCSIISLSEELEIIRLGNYFKIMNKCRLHYQSNNLTEYKSLKQNLPAVTFSGVFAGVRITSNLKYYNRLFVVDIDHLGKIKIENIKKIMQNDPYTLAVWLSPSGSGLKVLIKTNSNPNLHKICFAQISEYLFSKYEINIDKSGSDLTRLCFTSYDPDLFLNKDSIIFTCDLSL